MRQRQHETPCRARPATRLRSQRCQCVVGTGPTGIGTLLTLMGVARLDELLDLGAQLLHGLGAHLCRIGCRRDQKTERRAWRDFNDIGALRLSLGLERDLSPLES